MVNDGTGTATPRLVLGSDPRFDSPDYALESHCDEPLAPGQGCGVLVRWTPTTTGFHRNHVGVGEAGRAVTGEISFEGYVAQTPAG